MADGIVWKARWRWIETRAPSVPPATSETAPRVYDAMVLCSVSVTSRRAGREPEGLESSTASIRAPLPRSGVSHMKKSPGEASKSGGQVRTIDVEALEVLFFTLAMRPTTTR